MSLGYDLKKNFNLEVKSNFKTLQHINEVDLFQCLIRAFSSMSDYIVEEIHGNKCQVEYSEIRGWFSKPPRCELSDLVIIAFSKVRCQGRLIIIQNKVSRISGQLSNNYKEIYANLVQYELMCDRLIFSSVNGLHKGKPNTLINQSSHPSVCQYGLFYKDAYGGIDMSSITAQEFIFSHSTPAKFPLNSKSPCAKIMLPSSFCFDSLHSHNPKKDFVGARGLVDFGDLLEALYIGMPISLTTKNKILRDFKQCIRDASPTLRQLINDFGAINFEQDMSREKSYCRPSNDETSGNIIDMCRSLLLINVDASAPDPQTPPPVPNNLYETG